MIVLTLLASGNSDFLSIFTPIPFPLQWYVSWNINPLPVTGLPYNRNFGVYPGGPPAMDMTPAVPAVPAQEWDIRQITIFNPNAVPVHFIIQFNNAVNLPPNVLLKNCTLAASHTLTYNAQPGTEGGWQVFDATGTLISKV